MIPSCLLTVCLVDLWMSSLPFVPLPSRFVFYPQVILMNTDNGQIQSSGQRIETFEKLQIECGIAQPLKIPLHSNVRWGSAYSMLDRAYTLRQSINLFIASADERFGSITTLRRDGRVIKHIPWSAFKLSDVDWIRVRDAAAILAVCTSSTHCLLTTECNHRILILFNNTFHPRDSQRCGALSPRLRSFRLLGKRSAMTRNMQSTSPRSPMG
jgi:hypothetical protein